MGENPPKRIHPVAEQVYIDHSEARPILPRGSSKFSERSNSLHQLNQLQYSRQQPPPLPIMDDLPHKSTRKGCSCCKCMCWTICLLVLSLIIIGATAGILYLVFNPKLPQYSVNHLTISALRLNSDMSLYAKFNVRITAQNPNDKIGIFYQKGSRLSVWYSNTELCRGTLPMFYQGHRNRTTLNIDLTGRNRYGRTLMGALHEEQQTGRIPLDLNVDVPVRIELGSYKFRKVRILGKCLLVVDSLSANNVIGIKTSSCKFGLKL